MTLCFRGENGHHLKVQAMSFRLVYFSSPETNLTQSYAQRNANRAELRIARARPTQICNTSGAHLKHISGSRSVADPLQNTLHVMIIRL